MKTLRLIELTYKEFTPYKEVMRNLLKDFDLKVDKAHNFDEQFVAMLNAPQLRVFIFYIEDVPVGMYVGTIKITPFNTSLYVDCVVVATAHRGKRYGREMAKQMVAYVDGDVLIHQSELTASNPVAQDIYTAAGYVRSCGFRYKSQTSERH